MSKLDILKTPKAVLSIKVLLFFFLIFLVLRKTNSLDSYPTGDGPEYVLTTEAFYRHGSPDIRPRDSRLFKKAYTQRNKWENIYKSYFFDLLDTYIAEPNKPFKKNRGGLCAAKNNKLFGYHFFTYSLLNVPARYFIGVLKKNPLACFKYTNALLIILTCGILLFLTPFDTFTSILIAFSFYYSSVYWYLGWSHPEVFTACLIIISLWLFFQNYNYIPLLIISIATTQNQPLIFLTALMGIAVLLREKISIKTLLKTGLCTSIIIIPSLFYYYHFNTFNLITDEGYLDSRYQTFTRVFGFFFDINQGIVLTIPLILVLYVVFLTRQLFLSFKSKRYLTVDLFLLLALLATSLTVATMGNWNHGQAVINRYASWVFAVIFVHFFFLILDLSNSKKLLFASLIMVTQIATTLYHENFNQFDWTWNHHKPLADWVLKKHPSWYNPDPTIFGIRTNKGFNLNPETSPITYFDENKKVCKIMCLKTKLNELSLLGVPDEKIKEFTKSKKEINDWVYIDRNEYIPNKSVDDVYNYNKVKLAKLIYVPKILADTRWYNEVIEKAKVWKVSVDSALVLDGLYVLNLERETK